MHKSIIVFLFSLFTIIPEQCDGHARLMEPPARNTMWRFGFDTTPNYEDNQLFCGGIKIQWQDNKGKCGICGDAYNGRRIHETGGPMATNTTTRNYFPNSYIDVMIELIANHAGKFTFDMCWRNSTETLETEECFEKLKLKNGSDGYYLTGKEAAGMFFIPIEMPTNKTCDHCIFRWEWKTANNWGVCDDGRGKMGCGPQETYRNCADIYIGHDFGIRGPFNPKMKVD